MTCSEHHRTPGARPRRAKRIAAHAVIVYPSGDSLYLDKLVK